MMYNVIIFSKIKVNAMVSLQFDTISLNKVLIKAGLLTQLESLKILMDNHFIQESISLNYIKFEPDYSK